MKSTNLLLAFLAVSAIIVCSCAREGCLDPDSVNYDYNATKDDGSCVYEGDLLFWYDLATAQKYDTTGVETLKFYVNNEFIDSISTENFWESPPQCGTANAIQTTVDLGASKTGQADYKILSRSDSLIKQGKADISANTCNMVKIE